MSVFSRKGTKRVRSIAYGEIKRVVGLPEVKFFDGSIINTAAPIVTGAGGLLSNMAGGSTVTTRAGNEIRCRSLLTRWAFASPPTNTAAIIWRCIIGIDWESLGVTPTGALILQDPTLILSPLNITTSNGRFSILRDKLFLTNPGSTAAGIAALPGQFKTMKMYMKLRQNALFAGATVNDSLKGALFYYVMSSAAGANAGTFTMYSRFRFTDA